MAPSNRGVADYPTPPDWVRIALSDGIVIPAHPLALQADGSLDVISQRALTRYYHAAGAGGLAVGVHTTQFEIRLPQHDLLAKVLSLAAETTADLDRHRDRKTVLIAGICGDTRQASAEARLAGSLGYHIGLLSLAALPDADDDALLEHCERVAREIPLFGFYLQPAVGGRILSRQFWRRFVRIPNLAGIKVSPFDRYKTLDVLHALAEVGRESEVALYTGNDDAIVIDLLTRHRIRVGGRSVELGFAGGLLGHWACWTRAAVAVLERCKQARVADEIPNELLTLASEVTDCNAALFDAANGFSGCIAGIQHVLHEQGLLSSPRCLDLDECLSPGQEDELGRIREAYPTLIDDEFVREGLSEWLSDVG